MGVLAAGATPRKENIMTSTTTRTTRRGRTGAALGILATLSLGLAACSTGAGTEDNFPSSQIQMIVPWAAGGGTDLMTRKLATLAEKTCGTRIIISNVTGAASATGHQAMVDAKADGYTLGTATTELAILKHLGTANFSTEDVRGITQLAANPAMLGVAADSPYQTFEELQAGLKNGDTIRVATNGRGGTWDMAARGLGLELGTPFTEYAPFNGAAEMIPAVLGEQVEGLSPSAGELLQQIEGGKLRGLAVMSDERFEALPDVPTLKEKGVDWQLSSWIGVVAPAGTPEERVSVLEKCFGEAAESTDFADFMKKQGNGVATRNGEDFQKFIDSEYTRFEGLISELYG